MEPRTELPRALVSNTGQPLQRVPQPPRFTGRLVALSTVGMRLAWEVLAGPGGLCSRIEGRQGVSSSPASLRTNLYFFICMLLRANF